MYQDWMANTPIFGEIKNVYIEPEKGIIPNFIDL